MRVHLCGVRGSTAAVGSEFAEVGGNTSCVALAHDDESAPRLVLDAGTGLRAVSALMAGEAFHGTIMLGHLHWDHTQGLPFFRAGDRADAVTRVLVPEQGVAPLELLGRFMSPPAFPVLASELQGSWSFDSIDEGEQTIEGFTVLAREIPHKGGRTMGYRVSDAWSSLAYLSDHGPALEGGPGPEGFGPYHDAAMDLCRGVDLLIHDSQYTASELPFRIHFGHSAANYAVGLAKECGVGRVLLFHHDPERTDAEVAAIERALRVGEDITVDAAREGTTILLGASRCDQQV
ncbi:MAG: MBL fold metallo-hydrolase [Ilumatobacteraceae bacterium]